METATIVKQTKDYMLIKVPLSKGMNFKPKPTHKNGPMNAAERRLWRIIQQGEREYRKGKTIKADSIDEALKIYERRIGKKD